MIKFFTNKKLGLVIVILGFLLALTFAGDWLQVHPVPTSPTALVTQLLQNQQQALKQAETKTQATGKETGDKPATQPAVTATTAPAPTAATPPTGDEPLSFSDHLKGVAAKLIPIGTSLLLGLFVLSVAWLFYGRMAAALTKTMNRTEASERGKSLILRTFQMVYWATSIFVAITFIAPDLLSKLFVGVSILTAAMVLALQGLAKNFVSGVLLHVVPKCDAGDEVAILGMDVKGTIIDVGYLSTRIKTADGIVILPNSELDTHGVKHLNKPPSPIIIATR